MSENTRDINLPHAITYTVEATVNGHPREAEKVQLLGLTFILYKLYYLLNLFFF